VHDDHTRNSIRLAAVTAFVIAVVFVAFGLVAGSGRG
jgi:hypothetical protein